MTRFVHTCIRVAEIDRSVAFYGQLGFERRGQLNFESAYNVYLGLPGDGDVLELTVNVGREEPYDLGQGYNHMALVVDDLDALLTSLAEHGIEPEKPPYGAGGTDSRDEYRICFGRPRRLPDRADRRCLPDPPGPAPPIAGRPVRQPSRAGAATL